MCKKEFHLIKTEKETLAYFPQLKVCCELDEDVADSLQAFKKCPESLNDRQTKSLNSVWQIIEQLPIKPSVFDDTINGLTLMVSLDCNLRCSYCYADHGAYQRKRLLMSIETAKRAIDRLFSYTPTIKNIRFFGGEPLLNFDLVKEVCRYVTDELKVKNMGYNLETNGTFMNKEILETLKRYEINLSVSLDGPLKYHDANRLDCQGQGTYERVIQTVELLKKEQIEFGFQCTYTETHRDLGREELTKYLTAYTPNYKIAPCITPDLTGQILFDDEFKLVPLKYLTEKEPLFHIPTLQLVPPVTNPNRRMEFCEAQNRVAVFPNGSTYPCELLLHENFYMGNIFDQNYPGEKFKRTREMMKNFHRDKRIKNYWFRYLINPLCIGKLLAPDFDPDKVIKFDEKTEKFYERLIYEIYKIQNSDRREIFMDNVIKFYKRIKWLNDES